MQCELSTKKATSALRLEEEARSDEEDDDAGSLVDFVVSDNDLVQKMSSDASDSRCGVDAKNVLPEGSRRTRRQTVRLIQTLLDNDKELQDMLLSDVGDEVNAALEDENFEEEEDSDVEDLDQQSVDEDYEEGAEDEEEEDEEEEDDDAEEDEDEDDEEEYEDEVDDEEEYEDEDDEDDDDDEEEKRDGGSTKRRKIASHP